MDVATTETTTLRVPVALRNEVARLARVRGTTMLVVVTDAVEELRRSQWWASLHAELEALDDGDIAGHVTETGILDHASGDGIGDG